jgi:hypothetical protein
VERRPPDAFEVALGSNPFVDALTGEVDPLDAWLTALDRLAATGESVALPRPLAKPVAAAPAAAPNRLRPRPDAENLPGHRAMARLISEEANQKLASLLGRIDGWDRFGLSRSALAQAFPFFYALYKLYFRVRQDHEKIPGTIAGRQSRGFSPSTAKAVLDVLLHTDPAAARHRRTLARCRSERVLRVGQVVDAREFCASTSARRRLRSGGSRHCKPISATGCSAPRRLRRARAARARADRADGDLRQRRPALILST